MVQQVETQIVATWSTREYSASGGSGKLTNGLKTKPALRFLEELA